MIRTEQKRDNNAVYKVNTAAFESTAEAQLVDALREQACPVISLVAEEDGEIVGHIMFSPVTFPEHPGVHAMGLAPMAVIPACQNMGIGSKLVQTGLDQCRKLDQVAIVVLGHPDYYPRFGFLPAAHFGVRCEYDVPAEVFMIMELEPAALAGISGLVTYHGAFSNV